VQESGDLFKLIDNFDEKQYACVSEIVARLALMKDQKWTGQILIELNCSQGNVADMHCNRKEKVSFVRRRKVRSGGIR